MTSKIVGAPVGPIDLLKAIFYPNNIQENKLNPGWSEKLAAIIRQHFSVSSNVRYWMKLATLYYRIGDHPAVTMDELGKNTLLHRGQEISSAAVYHNIRRAIAVLQSTEVMRELLKFVRKE